MVGVLCAGRSDADWPAQNATVSASVVILGTASYISVSPNQNSHSSESIVSFPFP